MTTRYVCMGSVRGQCGVLHRFEAAAIRHCAGDHAACARLGGGAYSDRNVWIADADGRAHKYHCGHNGDYAEEEDGL